MWTSDIWQYLALGTMVACASITFWQSMRTNHFVRYFSAFLAAFFVGTYLFTAPLYGPLWDAFFVNVHGVRKSFPLLLVSYVLTYVGVLLLTHLFEKKGDEKGAK